jgi:quercetin dioxygenase-like cupin family protein
MKTQEYIKLIQSADTNTDSVLEMNIHPGEKTPWHYHKLFSETFEILKGILEVGKGEDIHHLTISNDLIKLTGMKSWMLIYLRTLRN